MEHMGAMLEGEWNGLSAMYTTHEEADFMAQLLGNCSGQAQNEQSLMYDHNTNTDAYSFSQGSSNYSNGSTILVPSSCNENYYLTESHQFLAMNNCSMSINFSGGEDKRDGSPPEVYTNPMMEMRSCLNREMSCGSLELSGGDLAEPYEKKLPVRKSPEISAPETQKKRSRVSGDVPKKRNVKAKKNQKLALDDDEDNNGGTHGQNSCSDEESNGSQELNGGVTSGLSPMAATVPNSSGKTRASRGSATDPQSLYARKRRERINERLKVLQNLVPNGTKVDISTMLEEAVQYVKFLQLQIKLLSSDDMWMYAPLAYNGMDLGLDLKIGIPMPRS